jgi:glycosyltransferase involved in cell wall biosynthesis
VRLDPEPSRIWLLATAVAGGYPTQAEVVEIRRGLALAEPGTALAAALAGIARTASASRDDNLDAVVLTGATVADVEFCATHVHNTGIQRVVRNTMPHWARDHDPLFVAWSPDLTGYRELTSMQRDLVLDYRSGMPSPTDTPASVLVIPWRSVILIPEVPAADLLPRQAALARFSGNRVVLVGHDAIPVANADTVVDAESDRFAHYLELVKYSSLIACNSEATTEEFAGFVAALAAQGLAGPRVSAVPLPVDLATPDTAVPSAGRTEPLVLTVGSVEPRKNQEGVLSAAQLLWAEGLDFELLVIGGGHSWYLEQFDREVRRLQRAGRNVRVGRGVSDAVLAQAYTDARVVVFPSLQEGYGLPVAEALATGTPVITTNYGSTAEIARDGGCLLVDPRSDDDIAAALRQILTNDEVHARLVAEARARTNATWADYAEALWADAHAPELPEMHS